MTTSTDPESDSGIALATAVITTTTDNSIEEQLATPSSVTSSLHIPTTGLSAAGISVLEHRQEESEKVSPPTDLFDDKENSKSFDNPTNDNGRRTSRRFHRSEQDKIIAPGFGTARDIRRLAAQLSEGNEIQLTSEAVLEVMNARGQGLAMSRSRRSANNAAEEVPKDSSSAWADFMKEEGVLADDAAVKPVIATALDRKRAQDSNDKDSKKTKADSTVIDDDETKDLLVQHHGLLLQTGSLDTLAVGRSKGSIKNPPSYNLFSPTKILPKVIVRSVHTGSNSCHSIAISSTGVVYGWGRNECHQLASNLLDDVPLPTVLELPKHSSVVSAATGKSHTLFLYADGSVYACGLNKVGQCGVKANLENIGSYRKCVFQEQGEPFEAEIKQVSDA
jgi:alpha-tubulin suppressor-like RCC1 family protein